MATQIYRCLFLVSGRVKRVDVIIYKVDRLGDWFLAEPSLNRVVKAFEARGESVVVWASQETAGVRAWRRSSFSVEEVAFEPAGAVAKLKRTFAVMRLLARYRAGRLVCLRHAPDPVRDYVLAAADVDEVHALSWRIYPGAPAEVPFEIERHRAILANLGIAPADTKALLPLLPRSIEIASRRVVVAPFSSAVIKDWADRFWKEVAAELGRRGFELELWVGPSQIQRAQRLAAAMSGGGTITVSVKSGNLGAFEEAIASASLVLCVDTFAAHLATALDTRMVCLLGGGQLGNFGPWTRSDKQRWLYHELPCFGCAWKCTQSSVRCMEELTPAAVLDAVNALL